MTIYVDHSMMREINFYPHGVLIDIGKTNSRGEFSVDTYLDKNDLQFWIKGIEFAQLNILAPNIDTTRNSDTLDLGTIYLVPYETELEVESYNIPELKRKKKDKYEKFTLNQVDSLFNTSKSNYGMELNSIDTIGGLGFITRYNFGPNTPRGTTISRFKQVTFRKVIK
jgi:hypothetical protein